MPAPEVDVPYDRDACHGAELAEALATAYPTDAHFAAYEPVEGRPGLVVRLDRDAPGAVPVRMVALVGDLDDPQAHAEKRPAANEWRASVEPGLRATGLAWHWTRGGARLLAVLDQPFEVRGKADVEAWRERHAAWREEVREATGLVLDPLDDWARLYRLPCVLRDGVAEAWPLEGRLVSVPLPASRGPAKAAPPPAPAPAEGRAAPAYTAATWAILASLGPAPEWQGRRWHVCGALGGLLRKAGWPKEAAGDLVRLWLDGHPGIDVRHGVDWALGAWERPPGEVSGSQVLAGLVGAELARLIEAGVMLPWRAGRALPSLGDAQPAGASAPEIPGWRVRRFADPEEPIEWSCEGLALAPSRGKISIIAGQPGAGKGPIADHLALCLATGSRAFGRYPSQAGPTLLLDFEGSRLTMRRLRRMASAMGLDPAELDQQLMIVDTSDCVDPLHEAWSSMLIEVVQRDRIRHVILDSYTTAMLGTAVEANSTAYAGLARLLGRLDCLVLCVAHATKAAAERAPRLADIGGTGALGALAQTAIFAHRPKDDDEHRIRVSCGRGPETRFAPFDVLFSDLEDGGLGLTAYDVPVEAAKTESGQPGVARPAHGTPVVEAGVRIWKFLRDSVTTHTRRELVDVGGGANRPAKAALALLVEAGVIQLLASHYGITPAGREKSQDDVVLALGLIGGAFGA